MRRLFFLALLPAVAFQVALFGQTSSPNSSPQVEVRIKAPNGMTSSTQTDGPSTQSQKDFETIFIEQPKKEEQRTLSILKPDTVLNRHIGDVISRFEDKGLRIIGLKMTKLNKEQAAKFYHVHSGKPFFSGLVDFMSSGPIVVLVLEGENAITKNRELMGATDPNKALPDTIRADFAQSTTKNAVHGSDSPEAAREEIQFFFKPDEIFSNGTQKK